MRLLPVFFYKLRLVLSLSSWREQTCSKSCPENLLVTNQPCPGCDLSLVIAKTEVPTISALPKAMLEINRIYAVIFQNEPYFCKTFIIF